MYKYLVTPELKTPLWKVFLRFLRLIKKRNEFYLNVNFDFSADYVLTTSNGKFRILKNEGKNNNK